MAACALLLGGCQTVSETTCRTNDWYAIGYRDAMYGIQKQDHVYVHQCEPQGAKVDVARYSQGWQEGRYEYDQRNKGPIY